VGGGVGLAAHAHFRIATENTVIGMPETKIGYSPDVGASSFMSRMDGELGTYLALTSDTLNGRAVL
jgi:3-hydroxyisobutyryl-CoA hydrolase